MAAGRGKGIEASGGRARLAGCRCRGPGNIASLERGIMAKERRNFKHDVGGPARAWDQQPSGRRA
jgi:hypothetical protein